MPPPSGASFGSASIILDKEADATGQMIADKLPDHLRTLQAFLDRAASAVFGHVGGSESGKGFSEFSRVNALDGHPAGRCGPALQGVPLRCKTGNLFSVGFLPAQIQYRSEQWPDVAVTD